MTALATNQADAAADARWHEWQVKCAANDRRSTAAMRKVAIVIGAVLVAWLAFQLV